MAECHCANRIWKACFRKTVRKQRTTIKYAIAPKRIRQELFHAIDCDNFRAIPRKIIPQLSFSRVSCFLNGGYLEGLGLEGVGKAWGGHWGFVSFCRLTPPHLPTQTKKKSNEIPLIEFAYQNHKAETVEGIISEVRPRYFLHIASCL